MSQTAQEDGIKHESRNTLLERLRTLNERVTTVNKDKKNAVAAYNDELKEINEEIEGTIAQLKNTPADDTDDLSPMRLVQ